MLRSEAVKFPEVVRWSTDGRAFFIDDESFFVASTLPRYGFKASKIQSFQVRDSPQKRHRSSSQGLTTPYFILCRQRNLNIYGFTRLTKGQYASGYVHKVFERDIGEKELDEVIRDSSKGKQLAPLLLTGTTHHLSFLLCNKP